MRPCGLRIVVAVERALAVTGTEQVLAMLGLGPDRRNEVPVERVAGGIVA